MAWLQAALGALVMLAAAAPGAAETAEAFLLSSAPGPSQSYAVGATSPAELCQLLEARASAAALTTVLLVEEAPATRPASPAHPVAALLGRAESSVVLPLVQSVGPGGLEAACGASGLQLERAGLDTVEERLASGTPFLALVHRPLGSVKAAGKKRRRLQDTTASTRALRFTPQVLAILVVTAIFLIILGIGLTCLGDIQTPHKLIGKGFAKPFKEY